jgi:hypothetical protein
MAPEMPFGTRSMWKHVEACYLCGGRGVVQWPWRAHGQDHLEICCPVVYSLLLGSEYVVPNPRLKLADLAV